MICGKKLVPSVVINLGMVLARSDVSTEVGN